MDKFIKHDAKAIVRLTDIAEVTDEEIWEYLVTPLVKGLLGEIQSRKRQILETKEGLFKGDEVSNLNDHRLYGGQLDYVRFPYEHHLYVTERGAWIVKRDGVKFETFCWFGDYKRQISKGNGELIFKAALRDRQFDGTRSANDTALVDFPYDDPKLNARLPIEAKCLELSIYGFLPGSRVVDATGEPDFDRFVEKPFEFLDRPELFRAYFDRAWKTNRGPGMNGCPMTDVSTFVPPGFEGIAARHGYDFIEVAPSHYHVARWAVSQGYRYTYPEQSKIMADFLAGIKRIAASGHQLTRQQESWVCVAQSLRADLIPDYLRLNGPVWPQDNIGPQNLWLNKPLNDKAKQMLP